MSLFNEFLGHFQNVKNLLLPLLMHPKMEDTPPFLNCYYYTVTVDVVRYAFS